MKSPLKVILVLTPHGDFYSGPLELWHGHKPVKPNEALFIGFPKIWQTCLIQCLRIPFYRLSQSFLAKSLTGDDLIFAVRVASCD